MIRERAAALCRYLSGLPGVRSCRLAGSVAAGTFDAYSDIDLELDVSGLDNGVFALELPALLNRRYPVLYADYAPSLAPQKYVVTAALFPDAPFLLADVSCVAMPHCRTVSQAALAARNNLMTHTLKVFTINLKHALRGNDCRRDIARMYARLTDGDASLPSCREMLYETFRWLESRADETSAGLLRALARELPFADLPDCTGDGCGLGKCQ